MNAWRMLMIPAWLLSAGCTLPPATPTTRPASPAAQPAGSPFAKPAEASSDSRIAALVHVRLVVLQLPFGSMSQSEEAWSYLNEEPILSAVGQTFSCNGIRIGLGRESDWPELAKILTRLAGQSISFQEMILQTNVATPINLKQDQPTQTMFVYRPDRTMTGDAYPPGDNILMTTGAVNYEDRASTLLVGSLVVRATQRDPRYNETPGGYIFSATPKYFPLPNLDFKFTVPAGGFVIVAPSSQAARPNSVGSHFLVKEKEALRYETVLVLFPQAVAAPAKASP